MGSPFTRHCKLSRLPLAVASWGRVRYGTYWNCSPWARHGELNFVLFHCFSSLLGVLTLKSCTNG